MKKQKAARKIKKALKAVKRATVRLEKLEHYFSADEWRKLDTLVDRLDELWCRLDLVVETQPANPLPDQPETSELTARMMEHIRLGVLDGVRAANDALRNANPEWPSELEP